MGISLIFFRSLLVAVFGAAFAAVVGTLMAHGFDVFSADWIAIGKLAVNGGFGGLMGYLSIKFFSPEGTTLGMKF